MACSARGREGKLRSCGRHCERRSRAAIQSGARSPWIASPGFAGFAMTISSWSLCLLERRGDLQLDRVADHRDAETEAEIAALDRRFGLEAEGLDMGHRSGTGAGEVDGERTRAGPALERQIAGNNRG